MTNKYFWTISNNSTVTDRQTETDTDRDTDADRETDRVRKTLWGFSSSLPAKFSIYKLYKTGNNTRFIGFNYLIIIY